MKKYRIIYLLIVTSLSISCKSFSSNKSYFIDSFMKNDEFYYSLRENSNKITIYDKSKELTKTDREFNKNDVSIKFTIKSPNNPEYFVVSKVIIDEKLAFIALRSFDERKNYVYYLIKNGNNWSIANVQINNTL